MFAAIVVAGSDLMRFALRCLPLLALLVFCGAAPAASAGPAHAWRSEADAVAPGDTIAGRFLPPPGFERPAEASDSFGAWLRGLPLKPPGSPVKLFTGALKPNQAIHAGVIDIDVGNRDLQQCADAVMRLRAEWLWSLGRAQEIAFDYTGGGRVSFSRWAKGERPSEDGKRWSRSAAADAGYASFRRYMTAVFIQAGTYSLARELADVPVAEMQPGDVFIKGGFPGHAVLVLDVVRSPATGETRFLLAQSYMPAQDIHVLKSPGNADGSPWYAMPKGALFTPEWVFPPNSLKRWR
jgi:hypothetical protein